MEYLNWYDFDTNDVFDEYTGLNVEILEDPELLEWFMYSRKIMRLQYDAIEAYNLLMGEFICTENGWLEFVYSDDYAGAFIDDNHNLIVQLTNMDCSTMEVYNILVEYSDVVQFVEVAHSLNELNDFGHFFVEVLEESDLQITSFGIDVKNNSFSISLYYADPESAAFVDSFSIMARALPVPISINLGVHMESRALEGGSGIGISQMGSGFSVGATGRSPMGNALVTTGHFEHISHNRAVFRGTTQIGTVMSFRAGNTGGGNPGTVNGDWSIISLNATGSTMMTNRLRTGEFLGPVSDPRISPPGTFVAGTGMMTLSWGGRIYRTNQHFPTQSHGTITGVTIVDYTGSNNSSVRGDSGGTIVSGSTTGGGLVFQGVLVGGRQHPVTRQPQWIFTPYHWFAHLFAPR